MSMQVRTRVVQGVVACLVCITLIAAGAGREAPPASADAFGVGASWWVADSLDHQYCYYNFPVESDRVPIRDSLSYFDDRTDLYDVENGSCSTGVDVMFISNQNLVNPDTGAPVRGLTTCALPGYLLICDGFWAAINHGQVYVETYWAEGNNYQVNLIKTIRHELGHTVGLQHYPQVSGGSFPTSGSRCTSCASHDSMISGPVHNGTGWEFLLWLSYNDHHVNDHINPTYN